MAMTTRSSTRVKPGRPVRENSGCDFIGLSAEGIRKNVRGNATN
jgi:hypothetical protein